MIKKLLKLIYRIFKKIPEDVNDDGEVNSLDLFLVRKKLLEDSEKRSDK